MNTTENNKLIAEFLGETKQPFNFPQFGYVNSIGEWKDTFFDNHLKFHKNWNWLMFVVEKILNISVELDVMDKYYDIIDRMPVIESVYKECITFIEWYNSAEKE